jgi:hypothetical protein
MSNEHNDPLAMLEEITAAIEEAMGIRTHVNIKNLRDPKLGISQQTKDNTKLLKLYETPAGKLFVDQFCAMSGNKNIRNLLGLPRKS